MTTNTKFYLIYGVIVAIWLLAFIDCQLNCGHNEKQVSNNKKVEQEVEIPDDIKQMKQDIKNLPKSPPSTRRVCEIFPAYCEGK